MSNSHSSTSSSQVGLFSTQISEQIVRLRALAEGRPRKSGQDVVALKRAVMATRLLAGSARILHFDSLRQFLDELLGWMQSIEETARPLATSESLVLESVIDLEERLLRRLEKDDAEPPDLHGFDEELRELHQLMTRRAARAVRETGQPQLPSASSVLLEGLRDMVERVEALRESLAPSDVEELRPLAERLGVALSIDRATATPADAASSSPTSTVSGEPSPASVFPASTASSSARNAGASGANGVPGASVDASDGRGRWARKDSVLDPLWEYLVQQSAQMDTVIGFEVHGDTRLLGTGLHDVTGQILRFLVEDICSCFREAISEGEELEGGPRVEIEILRDRSRLELVLRDNAPRMGTRSMLTDGGHLSYYRGLRRSRVLVQQLNGLVEVEPEDHPDQRFALMLPAELKAQTYCILQLENECVAVPWVRVVSHHETSGLVFEADEAGESFTRDGRTIPLVELAQFVPTLMPVAEMSGHILVAGSVEKRVGIYCEEVGEFVDTSSIGDPPSDWRGVSYGALEWEGRRVPILDIVRLIQLRYDLARPELAGSTHDPVVDSYVPSDTPVADPGATDLEAKDLGAKDPRVAGPDVADPRAADPEVADPEVADPGTVDPTAGDRPVDGRKEPSQSRRRHVLLVNQSEFRRREITRALEDRGHSVTAARDLPEALRHPRVGEVDVVVTDLRIGPETEDNLRRVRDAHPTLPLVLTTSVARGQAEELAAKSGADDCWLDPFRPIDLEEALDRIDQVRARGSRAPA